MRIRDWDINLKIRLIGEAFLNISFWMVFPFLTVYFSESFGRGVTSLLLIFSQILAVICGLFGGYFADQFGRRKMMLVAIAGEVIGYGLFAVASLPMFHSPLLGFIGFSLASLFANFYYPASQAMIADVIEDKYRSYVFSIFYMMVNIAVVIGPLIGSFFFANYRFQLLSFVTLASLLLFILLFLFAHETAPALQRTMTSSKSPSISWKQVVIKQMKDYSIILTDRIFLLFIIAGILLSQTFMQLDMFIPLHIHDTIDHATLLTVGQFQWSVTSASLYSLILAINGAMAATLTVITTKIMMKYHEKNAFIGSAILYGISIFLFGIFVNPWMYIISMIVFTLGELLTAGIQQNFIALLAPEDKRAMYFSAAQLRQSIGRVIAPISITLAAWVGSLPTAIIFAVLCFLAAWIYQKMYTMFDDRQRQAKKTYAKVP